jgi:hypothetical protein
MDIITCIYKSLVITKMIVILVELGKMGKMFLYFYRIPWPH